MSEDEKLHEDAEELRGRTFAEITHPDDVDTDIRLARRLFAGELPGYSVDKRYVSKDGGIVWVELTVSVIRDERGRPLRAMGLVQDITERRLLHLRLRYEATLRCLTVACIPTRLASVLGDQEGRGERRTFRFDPVVVIYDDPKTPGVILGVYASLPPAEKRDALATLASRAAGAGS